MVCKCHTVTFHPEIYVKMSIFKVDVQSDHLETKCSWVKVFQGKNVTVDVSSGSKCHSGRNVGGRNVKASWESHNADTAVHECLLPDDLAGVGTHRCSYHLHQAIFCFWPGCCMLLGTIPGP